MEKVSGPALPTEPTKELEDDNASCNVQESQAKETSLTRLSDDLQDPTQRSRRPADTWKNLRINLWRCLATLFVLFMLGAHDASIGVRDSGIAPPRFSLTSCRH